MRTINVIGGILLLAWLLIFSSCAKDDSIFIPEDEVTEIFTSHFDFTSLG